MEETEEEEETEEAEEAEEERERGDKEYAGNVGSHLSAFEDPSIV